ncbi:MAG TPA: cytochrome C oxidase subunit IV family protein [Candidatus Polarisedimenticolia bacterium]|jgi:cytochrome c oxidase subunit 4|nr:cytochrome C oxidase subunit IV family protein [Candidatus Polarisedimenticolia bacterium]
MSGHVVPAKIYFLVFAVLILCTALTVAAAFMDLGPFNLGVALAIAAFKATLVVLYFMHVRYDPKLIGLAIALALAWLGLLLFITFADYLTRGWVPFPGK